ncbi:phosphogluconate dehydratase [Henriciella barbarensis]|uniref:Phosphogluconate dehydratase n=1 Tax=Henriciella barbarensis TaxID=86342 RepID=A0A399QSU8_9PROT|nr:phosphogluconate dehydratase [Henriciella barbarensis]RIJ21314.1 phosphogluconate dehydratase [Henriciella barbarensis]
MTTLHPRIQEVTERIEKRSAETRATYLELIRGRKPDGFARQKLADGNLAHASAGCAVMDKTQLLGANWPNIGVITAYNDMLSAHAPYEDYPQIIRDAARKVNATAQVAGGVPAMCDGVTQGQQGMELSLFSRDVIALASAVSLSHDMFDGALHLGICDKIVPGLMIAALRFGWLPHIFVPGGPMPSGLPNPEKQRIRQEYALGNVDRDALLKAEAESYHSPGTCTFYGTANSNQMLMEVMGLHIPGAAFENPGTPLREALTRAAVSRVVELTVKRDYTPMGEMIDARSWVNAMVGLMATGGSTNHALHIPAMAAASGYQVELEDFADVSEITPLLCRIYPNGPADVNHFQAAGGMSFVMRELLQAGLLNGEARGIMGSITDHAKEPWLNDGEVAFRDAAETSGDTDIVRPASDPFQKEGGLRMLNGPLGRGVIKVSSVKEDRRIIEAPARVFDDQEALKDAFKAGELDKDFVAVVRFQGPAANGMPELHALSPALGALQDKGFRVALVTDGRMSGASGKIPAAIHVSPEAARGGPLACVQDGDMIRLNAETGELDIDCDPSVFEAREPAQYRPNIQGQGLGRELFGAFRSNASRPDTGGSLFEFFLPLPGSEHG